MIEKFKRKFSIPYNNGFANTLETYSDYIFDFYFSDDVYPSARVKSTDTHQLLKDIELARSLGIKSNYVLNSAYYSPEMYLPNNIKYLAEHLNGLNIDVLTINNMFLLQSQDFICNLNPSIMLKNSVNNKIDSVEKASLIYKKFGITDIIVDRNINRDRSKLMAILSFCRNNNLTSTIMLNEGCMPNCVYKQFCDLNTSIFDKDADVVIGRKTDTTGCGQDYHTDPDLVLKSPIITRPQVLEIIDSVDVIKIAGRNISEQFVPRILDYYLLNNKSLSLFDFSSTLLPETFKHINFYMLEEYDYSSMTRDCRNECYTSCNQCDKIINSIIKTKL
jgi:collagenase-like PrtC family protease